MTDIRSAPDPLVALREALKKPLDEVMIVAAILRENPETHSFSARLDRAAVGFRAALDSIEEGSRGPSNAEVATRLRWLADRLEMVYGESPNVDYLLHTRSMAAALAAASPSREGAGPRPVEEIVADLEVGPDPVYWQGYRDGKASREGAGLDVEQLTRALRKWDLFDFTYEGWAHDIAAEYARLTSEEQTDD